MRVHRRALSTYIVLLTHPLPHLLALFVSLATPDRWHSVIIIVFLTLSTQLDSAVLTAHDEDFHFVLAIIALASPIFAVPCMIATVVVLTEMLYHGLDVLNLLTLCDLLAPCE